MLDLRLGERGTDIPIAPRWKWATLDEGQVDEGDVYTPGVLTEVLGRATRTLQG